MGVFLSGRELLVPKQFLNAAEISPVAEQVSGKGVAKEVRVNIQKQGASLNVLL
jgi:hypothetical protein